MLIRLLIFICLIPLNNNLLLGQHTIINEETMNITNKVKFIDEIYYNFDNETFEIDSSWISKMERYYNKNGRAQKVIVYDKKGKVNSIKDWTYNFDGQVLTSKTVDSAILTYQTKYKYDNQNRKIGYETYNYWDSTTNIVTWNFLNDSVATKSSTHSSQPRKHKKTRNSINVRIPQRKAVRKIVMKGKNGLDKIVKYYSKNQKFLNQFSEKYNEDSLLIEQVSKNKNEKTTFIKRIAYENKKKKSSEEQYQLFKNTYNKKSEFDSYGNIIKSTTTTKKGINFTSKYKYHYNKKGNWIKQIVYFNGKPNGLTLRYIKYYK